MNQDKERDGYIESLQGQSDRKLLELQTYYARKQADHLKSIDGRLFMLFLLMVIAAGIGIYAATA